jgi:branched-chain amino acid transport system ATP-binding protein
MESVMLKCKNLTKRFGKLLAVNNLSFEVKNGEIFGIAGPNGAGKTTLFNLITGIYQGSGEITFEGENIQGCKPYEICHKGIARTFQIPQVFLTLSVIENVRVGAHFGHSGIRNEMKNIKEVIDFVGLSGKENVIGANLKLLDKKLVMIAAALATKPRLLLLDEPIAGLSPEESRQSITMFKRINKELGLTIIIIEHFMKALTELSSRLLILQNGGEICVDSPLAVSKNKKVIECYLGENHA